MQSTELVYERRQSVQMVLIPTVLQINSTNKSTTIHIVLLNSISLSYELPVILTLSYRVSLATFAHLKQKCMSVIKSRHGVPQQLGTYSV